jgi:hypothetical protein
MWGPSSSLRTVIFQDDEDTERNDLIWMLSLGILALILLLVIFVMWKGCRKLNTNASDFIISPNKINKRSKSESKLSIFLLFPLSYLCIS